MDGYTIDRVCLTTYTGDTFENIVAHPEVKTIYRVYNWYHVNNRTIKHYHNGYDNYKQMISNHPELKA